MNCESTERSQRIDILFVDDDRMARNALNRLFKRDSLTIRICGSAEEALFYLDTPVRILVADHQMPGMSGLELLKYFANKGKDTIRILLTGFANVDTMAAAINESQVHRFISKPWINEDFRQTVFESLANYSYLSAERHKQRQLEEKLNETKNHLYEV
ncbi:response regulator [Puniceicoccaceae bacterium K14]|nr:response regulator [Puniceicoccaceae bacterium K14]